MRLLQLLILVVQITHAKLLIDFKGSDPISSMGQCQLEAKKLGDHLHCGQGIDPRIFIRAGSKDPSGASCVHLHRDPQFRRAEIKGKGTYGPNKRYFVGYHFQLSNIRQKLSIFQWLVELG